MIITTCDEIPGKKIVEVIGLVKGNTIRARHLGRDIVAVLRNVVGGEVVVTLRFSTSSMMQGAAELLAYGTAVKVVDDK